MAYRHDYHAGSLVGRRHQAYSVLPHSQYVPGLNPLPTADQGWTYVNKMDTQNGDIIPITLDMPPQPRVESDNLGRYGRAADYRKSR
ncbi:hypothetical protein [Sulfobacillus sp. hq2]|uniref:hypothetical protein n=1 Tax=Sulfobacillus TaxID=28033 RepID=UPI0015711D58|nr:hypothetical protein [Sulfobacillus sp. hq2]MCY0909707.1 hypothetical protein [Sulfobacillus thermotolerans]